MLRGRAAAISLMSFDLHTHTSASDGALTPRELVRHAAAAGVTTLAITDHDSVAGLLELPHVAGSPQIVAGVEFSTTWHGTGVHVLGLNIDARSDAMRTATGAQRAARRERAERIGERLAHCGVPNAFAQAQRIAGNDNISRVHFAAHLVEAGHARSPQQAFKRYLGAGKAGDVRNTWAPLAQVIEWIRAAGGTATLAHPMKYGLTRTKRRALIAAFAASGGQAIEVISGRQDPARTQALADDCTSYGLLASAGSDFHRPDEPWARLGMPLTLPAACTPVWDRW